MSAPDLLLLNDAVLLAHSLHNSLAAVKTMESMRPSRRFLLIHATMQTTLMETITYLLSHPSSDAVKGERGTILIVGGSREYTGAPYFAAMGSLRAGADLVYVFAQEEAVQPIKALIPEAIVMTIEYREWVLRRITACAIGPGLGRIGDETLKTVASIVQYLNSREIPLVVDGDGLRYYNEAVFKEYKTMFLTPNINEKLKTRWIKESHCLIEKGRKDIIRLENISINVTEKGSVKRCGGQGDILVGILCALMSLLPKKRDNEQLIGCAECACKLTRLASRAACREKWTSLIASDILDKIPAVMLQYRQQQSSSTPAHDSSEGGHGS